MRAVLTCSALALTMVATAAHASTDPVKANPNTGASFNRYNYANNNPYKYTDPDGRATVIVVNNNTPVIGTHSGLVILRGDKATIYDPAGSFRNETKGSGGIVEGPRSDFREYVQFQQTDGPDVQLHVFATTPEQEAQIISNAEDIGDPRGFSCTSSVTSAIQGIGAPLNGIKTTAIPSRLEAQLRQNPNQQPLNPPPPQSPTNQPIPEPPKPIPDDKQR